uniref:Uncharacterized protein n=1 Tax=Panagrolaimus sp. PS1159 TaxID=55785 RepID=A0AC35FRV1_9BILA
MACSASTVSIILICLLFLPIALTLAFGVALYTQPKIVSSIGMGYHVFCIILHAVIVITFYLHRIKEGEGRLRSPFALTFATIILVVFQCTICTFGIVFSRKILSEKRQVKCIEISLNSTDSSFDDNKIAYMNDICNLELYLFFGATLILLFRLPTFLWGLCEGGFLEAGQRLRSNHRHRRHRTSSASLSVFSIQPPSQSSVYPEPPPLPPPPIYHFENDCISMDSTKLPTYDQAIRLPKDV